VENICVIGLGYVGLPVALAISKKFNTIGYDINKRRLFNLKRKIDTNNEFSKKDFLKKKISFTNNYKEIKDCNFFIVCVPTPITKNNIPDLRFIDKSVSLLAKVIKGGDIIVLESTVYPGITEKFSKKLSLKVKLDNNKDFFTCYSPERINPGDNSKKLKNIKKVFAINTNDIDILNRIKKIYDLISKKIIFTKNIPEAETAKAIENTQRDLNIALYNELLVLSDKMNLNFNEVIRLASSKWNFLKFKPGLVGGHCLPVDPYYLSYIASKNKFKMRVALAGRTVNNNMKNFVLQKFYFNVKRKKIKKNSNILLVGLSYKYGVADLRNSLNLEIFEQIKKKFKKTQYFDPFINEKNNYKSLKNLKNYKTIIFLSYGKIFLNIFKKLKQKKVNIIDPFRYYEKF
tara:strand:- start:858 stop:2063 length:1206 start_codon:yes stop_codon:yes gene_type:complete